MRNSRRIRLHLMVLAADRVRLNQHYQPVLMLFECYPSPKCHPTA